MSKTVSVVMSVRNGAAFIQEAVQSLLCQDFLDFELCIRDDASTDETMVLLQSFARSDARILLSGNEERRGLARNLNALISSSAAIYIARMDADDVAERERLKLQVLFLNQNPAVGVLGTSAFFIDERGRVKGKYVASQTHGGMKWRALFSNPVIHPSVMVRRSVMQLNPYDEAYQNSQDYELWSRLLFEKGIRFANLPQPLLRYRIHSRSITQSRTEEKKRVSLETSLRNIRRYVEIDGLALSAYTHFRMGQTITFSELRALFNLLRLLRVAFVRTEVLSSAEMREVVRLYRMNVRSVYVYGLKEVLRKMRIFH